MIVGSYKPARGITRNELPGEVVDGEDPAEALLLVRIGVRGVGGPAAEGSLTN